MISGIAGTIICTEVSSAPGFAIDDICRLQQNILDMTDL